MMKKRSSNNYHANIGRRRKQTSLYSRTETIKERNGGFKIFRLSYIFILIFFISLGYIIIFSEFFKVREVVISETKFASREEIMGVLDRNNYFLNDNIVTFGLLGVSKPLKKITGISDVKIIRKSLNRVELKIVEEVPLLVWQTSSNKYLISNSGMVWSNFEDKYSSLPVVIDNKNLPVSLNEKILPTSFVTFFKDLQTGFENSSATRITRFEVLDIISDLKVTTEAGWYVIFDTSRTAQNQFISLKRVLEEVRIKGKKLEYVDLRIDSRIFYK